MAIFSNVEPLKMWVHKILPLVYDDSMSYYETLCKVVQKLNEVVSLSNEQTDYLNNWLTSTEESLSAWKTDTRDELEGKINDDLGAAIERLETEFANELLDAEGMIYGTQNDVPVEEGNEYYQNNAEYFKERASASAIESRAYANGENASPLFANNNSKYFRERSEAWAVGQINGADVPDTDDTYENNAEYYAEQAREAALTFAPDPTLSEAGRPADAKATGDAIDVLNNAVLNSDVVDYEQDYPKLTYDIAPNGKWRDDSESLTRCVIIPLSGALKVRITAGSGKKFVIAFLTTDVITVGETPSYSTGYSGRITSETDETKEYSIQGDMNFLYLLYSNSSGVTADATVTLITNKIDDINAEIANINSAIEDIDESIDTLETTTDNLTQDLYYEHNFYYDDLPKLAYDINSANHWGNASGQTRSIIIPLTVDIKKVKITSDVGKRFIIAFLNDATITVGETPDFSTNYEGRITSDYDATLTYDIKSDMRYLYLLYQNVSAVKANVKISFYRNSDLNYINSKILNIDDYKNLGLTQLNFVFEQGSIDSTGLIDSQTVLRSVDYIPLVNDLIISCDTNYQVSLVWYEFNGSEYTYKGALSQFEDSIETVRNSIDGTHIKILIKKEDDANITISENYHVNILGFNSGVNEYLINPAFHNVCHRGFNTIAPENTIPAFSLARKLGFRYVECDVQFTSDDVAVILHDRSITRTSNGTGNIDSMTYSAVSQYDFGSWKNPVYAGTKIPTFEEFIVWCKESGVKPYIELKADVAYTQAQISSLVTTVQKYGFLKECTWISFDSTLLGYLHSAEPDARIGYLVRNSITAANVATIKSLQDSNEIFLLCHSSNHSFDTTTLPLATDENIRVEVTIVDNDTLFNSMDLRYSGNVCNGYPTDRKLWEKANGTV